MMSSINIYSQLLLGRGRGFPESAELWRQAAAVAMLVGDKPRKQNGGRRYNAWWKTSTIAPSSGFKSCFGAKKPPQNGTEKYTYKTAKRGKFSHMLCASFESSEVQQEAIDVGVNVGGRNGVIGLKREYINRQIHVHYSCTVD